MMRVAVFVEHFPPKLGSDRRIFELVRRLSHRHDIHFIVFPPIRRLLNPTQDSITSRQNREGTVTERHQGMTVHVFSLPLRIALLWQDSIVIPYLLTCLLTLVKATRVIGKLKPDIIVLNYPSPYTGLLGLLEGKLWRKKVVLDFNDLIAQYTIALLNIRKDSLKAKLLISIQNYIVKNAKRTTVPTSFIREYASNLGTPRKDIALVPNGVDTKEFDPQRFKPTELGAELNVSKEKTCLYCGRLDTWAGTNIILKLCTLTKKSGLNLRFVLVGSGEEESFCREKAVYLGEVPYEKVPSLLSTADVILVPFPNNEVSHAASPLKLFEAMSMQKPVVASRTSGIEDVIVDGENGFLASPDNIDEWVEKLRTILESGDLAAKMGLNARLTVKERFDWNFLAKQFEDVLKNAHTS